MTTSALKLTGFNFGNNKLQGNTLLGCYEANSVLECENRTQQESQIARFVITDISTIKKEHVGELPAVLKIGYYSLLVISLFFIVELLLSFFNKSFFSLFTNLAGLVSFGGLFKVLRRIDKEIKEKGFIK
jgi:hypothetical protein